MKRLNLAVMASCILLTPFAHAIELRCLTNAATATTEKMSADAKRLTALDGNFVARRFVEDSIRVQFLGAGCEVFILTRDKTTTTVNCEGDCAKAPPNNQDAFKELYAK